MMVIMRRAQNRDDKSCDAVDAQTVGCKLLRIQVTNQFAIQAASTYQLCGYGVCVCVATQEKSSIEGRVTGGDASTIVQCANSNGIASDDAVVCVVPHVLCVDT
eukprot:Opistho-2@62083